MRRNQITYTQSEESRVRARACPRILRGEDRKGGVPPSEGGYART